MIRGGKGHGQAAAIRGLGVEAADVQTSELNLSPIYTPVRPDTPAQSPERVSGYTASNVVSVHLSKLDLVGRVIDAGLGERPMRSRPRPRRWART